MLFRAHYESLYESRTVLLRVLASQRDDDPRSERGPEAECKARKHPWLKGRVLYTSTSSIIKLSNFRHWTRATRIQPRLQTESNSESLHATPLVKGANRFRNSITCADCFIAQFSGVANRILGFAKNLMEGVILHGSIWCPKYFQGRHPKHPGAASPTGHKLFPR